MSDKIDSTLESLAHQREEANTALGQAKDAHRQAVDRAENIQLRIEKCRSRQHSITDKRLSGHENEQDSAEFATLNGDIAGLGELHAKALAEAETLSAALQEATWQRDRLQQKFNERERELITETIHSRVIELEAAYLAAVSELARRADQAGIDNLRDVYSPHAGILSIASRTHTRGIAFDCGGL